MKANELMIGDWVMQFGEPRRIVGIRTDAFYPYIKTNMGDTWYEEGMKDLAEPIPLTPEILEKNFGEEVKIHPSAELCYLLLHKEFKYSIILYKKENSFRLDISDQSTFSYIKKQVNYIHELQHALRLCGIEKEIEL